MITTSIKITVILLLALGSPLVLSASELNGVMPSNGSNTLSIQEGAGSFEKTVRSIGCKIRKPNSSILYDDDLENWKKKEFGMVRQTILTASYGSLIYFEEEEYASEQAAKKRFENFKSVSPEVDAKNKATHGKRHPELELRKSFQHGNSVYFVSVTSYGAWLDGVVEKYRMRLENALKE